VDEIDHYDKQRDHSWDSLTKDEKNEIALFHSLKQDPYYKHYIYNHLRYYAEDQNDALVNFPTSGNHLDIYDTAKFDKLNIFDLRRNIPQKAREALIDSKNRAYGYAKRKKAKALVQVNPGVGKIYVNGKPMLNSLFMPM